jgi:plasmid stabilization system protein ParE
VDYTIAWTETALADLEVIVRHVAANSPAAAEKLRLELTQSVEVLARFPFIGPAYEDDPTNRVRQILCRRYRIFYQVDEIQSRVEIVTVRHGARQEPRFPA